MPKFQKDKLGMVQELKNTNTEFWKGIGFALSACFLWALVFIIPQYMLAFNPVEITLGRYLCFGLISATILMRNKLTGHSLTQPMFIWKKALLFSLIASLTTYSCLVFALKNIGPAICALIFGMSPITIAFYGNWKEREYHFKYLIIPSLLMFGGLILVNISHLYDTSYKNFFVGCLFILISLSAWTWFVVNNARFLKLYKKISSFQWATLIGIANLFWVSLAYLVLYLFFPDYLNLDKYTTWNTALVNYLVGCLVLGCLCSWLALNLWNQACRYLPITLAGQLTLFETIFGLGLIYLLDRQLPAQTELIGIGCLLVALAYGIYTLSYYLPQVSSSSNSS